MHRLAWLTCIAVASHMMAPSPAKADENLDWFWPKRGLEGAWEVVVTVRLPEADCANATPVGFGPNPFPSFNTFHEGGTMSEWGSRSPPSRRSSGHGVWERTGFNKYRYRLKFHGFDVNGLLAATMDIRSDLRLALDGKTFEGVSRFVLTDISGNAQNFCATSLGERIALTGAQ